MSERKVLNKYYPPDFDPSKIPRCKVKRDGKFGIRLMAPFNMRCNTCGEYIYKGKKFNSRKENVDNENYLGLHIFRFYIKCPRCVAEIVFKTDPENTDYTLEAGATRNFEALRTAERLARQEMEEKEEEEKNNPMKLLENRTKASLQEMDMIETLEELRDLRSRHSGLSLDDMIKESVEEQRERERQQQQREQDEDESFVQSLFGPNGSKIIKRIESDDDDDDDDDDDEGKEEETRTREESGTRVSAGLKRSEDSSVSSTSNKKIKYSSDNPTEYLTQDFPPPTSSSSTSSATSSSQTKTIKTTESASSKKTSESSQNKEKSSQRNLLAGLVVRAKGKEPINKSSTVTSAKSESSTVTSTSGQSGGSGGTGTSGGAVKEDVGPVKPSSSGAGLACLASYSSSDSDSDS